MMNIGEAARASGVSAKMIRHYEQAGLFPEPARTESGYRQYGEREVHTLRFIRHARDLGFSIEQIGTLLGLWQDRRRPSRQVKALAQSHIEALQQKLQDIEAMKATLERLVHCCHGDERPDCPILEELAQVGGTAPAPTARARSGHVLRGRSS
jgi:MerR family copper efflux transcriptional regulator